MVSHLSSSTKVTDAGWFAGLARVGIATALVLPGADGGEPVSAVSAEVAVAGPVSAEAQGGDGLEGMCRRATRPVLASQVSLSDRVEQAGFAVSDDGGGEEDIRRSLMRMRSVALPMLESRGGQLTGSGTLEGRFLLRGDLDLRTLRVSAIEADLTAGPVLFREEPVLVEPCAHPLAARGSFGPVTCLYKTGILAEHCRDGARDLLARWGNGRNISVRVVRRS